MMPTTACFPLVHYDSCGDFKPTDARGQMYLPYLVVKYFNVELAENFNVLLSRQTQRKLVAHKVSL